MRILLSLLLACTLVACAPAPPTLSPQAASAYNKTRIIHSLDLLRETAVDLAAQKPPLITFADRQRVVQFHESSLKVMNSLDQGWVQIVQTALAETMKDLPPNANRLLAPYGSLASTLLAEVPR